MTINEKRALAHLMDLLRIEGLSGDEGRVAAEIKRKLVAAGCKSSWMKHDTAHTRIPKHAGDYKIGNLIVKLPGTTKGDRRLFMGHMDTVPLCRGAVPVKKGKRIVSKGDTGLGADNRSAVACLVTTIETLLQKKLPHPPTTILFSIAEEVGLWGARTVRLADLGNPKMGFNVDSGAAATFVVGALGADRWEAHVHGISSHAGVHPDHGVSAALIATSARSFRVRNAAARTSERSAAAKPRTRSPTTFSSRASHAATTRSSSPASRKPTAGHSTARRGASRTTNARPARCSSSHAPTTLRSAST